MFVTCTRRLNGPVKHTYICNKLFITSFGDVFYCLRVQSHPSDVRCLGSRVTRGTGKGWERRGKEGRGGTGSSQNSGGAQRVVTLSALILPVHRQVLRLLDMLFSDTLACLASRGHFMMSLAICLLRTWVGWDFGLGCPPMGHFE